MEDTLNQFPKGSDISIEIYGDESHPISEVYADTVRFSLLLYRDNLDLSIEENRLKVISVLSTDRTMAQDNDKGYVVFDVENDKCTVIIPWVMTQNMDAGHYTVDIVWGVTTSRVIFHSNSFLVLVDSTGTYVDENMNFDE